MCNNCRNTHKRILPSRRGEPYSDKYLGPKDENKGENKAPASYKIRFRKKHGHCLKLYEWSPVIKRGDYFFIFTLLTHLIPNEEQSFLIWPKLIDINFQIKFIMPSLIHNIEVHQQSKYLNLDSEKGWALSQSKNWDDRHFLNQWINFHLKIC